MDTYLVFRRSGWRTSRDLDRAATCSMEEGNRLRESVAWIRSYVVAELDGTVGTVCVFQATSPEAIRVHADGAELPVDEIVKVADTMIVRDDPIPATP